LHGEDDDPESDDDEEIDVGMGLSHVSKMKTTNQLLKMLKKLTWAWGFDSGFHDRDDEPTSKDDEEIDEEMGLQLGLP